MDSLDWHTDRATLEWLVDLGATEAITDAPINRYELEAAKPKVKAKSAVLPPKDENPFPKLAPVNVDAVAEAELAVANCTTLSMLRDAMVGFQHCDLRKGARNLVFSDGNPEADLMIIGEAPGKDEDIKGTPFVGKAGQLLTKMLAAINIDREQHVYITNILPWRPPQNRDPKPDEVAMMMPFLRKHVELTAPKVLVCMGNHSCHAVIGKRGITKIRGQWDQGLGLPVLPMLHPAYLLRQPIAKRDTWMDLLKLQAKLKTL